MTSPSSRQALLAEKLIHPQFPHVEHADLLPEGWLHWMRWEQLVAAEGPAEWWEDRRPGPKR